ncbi:22440_t:CDS:1, partial [Dentiscutata erythropus]
SSDSSLKSIRSAQKKFARINDKSGKKPTQVRQITQSRNQQSSPYFRNASRSIE